MSSKSDIKIRLSTIKIFRFLVCFNYSALIIVLIVFYWASSRGLDISDESYYLIGYLKGINPTYGFSSFHWIYAEIFGFLQLTVKEIRLLGVVLIVASSALFSHSLIIYLRYRKLIGADVWLFHFMLPVITIGSFLGFSWLPLTPSYNTFSLFYLQLIVAFCLYSVSVVRWNLRLIFYFLIGFFLSASFYNKFPNAVTATLSILFFYFFSSYKGYKELLTTKTFWALVVIIAGIISFPLTIFDYEHANKYLGFFQFASSVDEAVVSNSYFETYWSDIKELGERLRVFFIILLIFVSIPTALARSTKWRHYTQLMVEAGLVLIVCSFILINDSYLGGADRKHFLFDIYLISGFLLFLVLWNTTSITASEKGQLFVISIFIGSFLAGSVGTGNPLSVQSTIYVCFVTAIGGIIACSLNRKLIYIGTSLVVLTCCTQIVTGIIIHPYREFHGVVAQKYNVNNIDGLSNIKLDSAKYDLLNQLQDVRSMKEKYIYSYSTQLGLVLFTEKIPYAFGWCEESPDVCAKLIQGAPIVKPDEIIFILPSKIEMNVTIRYAFAQKGILFPENYVLEKEIGYTDCQYGGYREVGIWVNQSSIQDISTLFTSTK